MIIVGRSCRGRRNANRSQRPWSCECGLHAGLQDVPGARRFAIWSSEDVEGVTNMPDGVQTFPSAELVGFSSRCLYYVCPLLVQTNADSVALAIQSRSLDCSWKSLAESTYVVVPLPACA